MHGMGLTRRPEHKARTWGPNGGQTCTSITHEPPKMGANEGIIIIHSTLRKQNATSNAQQYLVYLISNITHANTVSLSPPTNKKSLTSPYEAVAIGTCTALSAMPFASFISPIMAANPSLPESELDSYTVGLL